MSTETLTQSPTSEPSEPAAQVSEASAPEQGAQPVEPATPAEPAEPAAKDAQTPAEPASTKTLLDDDDAQPAAPSPGEQPAQGPSAEEIEKFCSGIKATDLGDGVTWSDDALKAMAPSLMQLTGGDPAKADGVVKAYSSFVQEQSRRQQEAAEAFNTGLIKECQQRFGSDLKKVARYAREGGLAIFGDSLWAALKSTPAFANNPDIIERLAEYGRRIAEDGGVAHPDDGAHAPTDEDVLHRMYGNVKVG